MKIKRLSNISLVSSNKVVEDELPKTPNSKFIVDDSAFCPMSEAVKQLSKISPVSSQEIEQYYDFPSGHDDGRNIPFERSASFSDITELSNSIIEDTHKIANDIEKKRKDVEKQKAFDKMLNRTKDSGSSTTSSPSGE